jgi:hypothetical protein
VLTWTEEAGSLTPLMKRVIETAYGVALERGETAVVHLTGDGFRIEYQPAKMLVSA